MDLKNLSLHERNLVARLNDANRVLEASDRNGLVSLIQRLAAPALAPSAALIEAIEGVVHFSDALNHRTDTMSVALRQWIAGADQALNDLKAENPDKK